MADSDVPTFDDLAADLSVESPTEDVKEETVELEPTTAESSPKETVETEEPSVSEDAKTDSEDEASTEEEPELEEEAPLPTKAEERKTQLNTEIRDLVEQRRDLKTEVERLNNQVYAPQTIEELTEQVNPETGDYYSRLEARVMASEQRDELRNYNDKIVESQAIIENQSLRALRDFPMFNPDSTEFNAELADRASVQLANAIQYDPNTQTIVGTNMDIYNYYETIASAVQASTVSGQLKGQRASQEMLASAEPSSRAVPAAPKEDPFLAGLTKGLSR